MMERATLQLLCRIDEHLETSAPPTALPQQIARIGFDVVKLRQLSVTKMSFDQPQGCPLIGIAALHRQTPVYGISESSGIVLQGGRARAIGPNPVVVLDARRSLFAKGDNGSMAAFNVLLDVYQASETIGAN